MKGYLIYATRYGSTKQVCQWISEGIPFSVSTRQVSDFPVDTVDFLILGTPVFIGKPAEDMTVFIKRHKAALCRVRCFCHYVVGAVDRIPGRLPRVFRTSSALFITLCSCHDPVTAWKTAVGFADHRR